MKKTILLFMLTFSFAAVNAQFSPGFTGAGDEEPGIDLGAIMVEEEEDSFSTGLNDMVQSTALFKNTAITGNSSVTVGDLLGEVPGIYFNKSEIVSYGTGVFTPSVMKIRGLGETPNSGILLVIDGRPQSMGTYRHPLLDSVALDSIESIEVIKGPSGVLYGNQAVAGVINIKTKKRELEGGNYTIGTMIGSHFTQNHFVSAVIKKEEIDINVSGSYSSTGGSRPNSDSYLENVHAHGGYEIEKDLLASFNIDYAYIRTFNPGPLGVSWPREAEASQTIQRDGDFRIEYKLSDYSGSTMFFSDSGSNKFLQNSAPPLFNTFVPGSYSQYENHGIRIMNEWVIFPGNSTKAGFDWQYFGGFYSSAVKELGWHENDYAPYVSISQEVGIFGLAMGLRYEFNSAWGSVPVPQAGFKLSLFDQHTVYINVSKGFKTPAMGVWVVSNYDELKPEEYWQYEIGTTHTIFEDITYNAAIFQTEGGNIMQKDPVDGKLKNTGFIMTRGVEADISGKFFKFLKAGINGTYVDPRNKTARVALLSGSGYLRAEIMKKGSIKISADFAKNRYDADNYNTKLSDYLTFNISADFRIDIFETDSTIYLDVENILDSKYEIKAGYPAAGFLVKGGVVVRF